MCREQRHVAHGVDGSDARHDVTRAAPQGEGSGGDDSVPHVVLSRAGARSERESVADAHLRLAHRCVDAVAEAYEARLERGGIGIRAGLVHGQRSAPRLGRHGCEDGRKARSSGAQAADATQQLVVHVVSVRTARGAAAVTGRRRVRLHHGKDVRHEAVHDARARLERAEGVCGRETRAGHERGEHGQVALNGAQERGALLGSGESLGGHVHELAERLGSRSVAAAGDEDRCLALGVQQEPPGALQVVAPRDVRSAAAERSVPHSSSDVALRRELIAEDPVTREAGPHARLLAGSEGVVRIEQRVDEGEHTLHGCLALVGRRRTRERPNKLRQRREPPVRGAAAQRSLGAEGVQHVTTHARAASQRAGSDSDGGVKERAARDEVHEVHGVHVRRSDTHEDGMQYERAVGNEQRTHRAHGAAAQRDAQVRPRQWWERCLCGVEHGALQPRSRGNRHVAGVARHGARTTKSRAASGRVSNARSALCGHERRAGPQCGR